MLIAKDALWRNGFRHEIHSSIAGCCPAADGGLCAHGADAVARPVAEALSRELGQPVIVVNKPGANGVIGAELVAKATPDGHTLLVTSASFAVNPAIRKKLPFDVTRARRAGAVDWATTDIQTGIAAADIVVLALPVSWGQIRRA